MRSLFFGAVLVIGAATIGFLACSSDDPANPNANGDGGAGSSGTGTSGTGTGTSGSPGDDDGSSGNPGDEDAGTPVTNDGCILYSTGYKSGKVAEILARSDVSGAVAWTNPTGAIKEDDQVAQVVLGDGQQSQFLRVSDFGITLPAGCETWGFEIHLERRVLEDGGVMRTSFVNAEIDGKTPTGHSDQDGFFWPRPPKGAVIGKHDYGQPLDSWGADINPSDFTKPTFAAKIAAIKGSAGIDGPAGPITGVIDALQVRVWYADGDKDHCTKLK